MQHKSNTHGEYNLINTSLPFVSSSKLSDVNDTARSAPRTLSTLAGSRPGGSLVKHRAWWCNNKITTTTMTSVTREKAGDMLLRDIVC